MKLHILSLFLLTSPVLCGYRDEKFINTDTFQEPRRDGCNDEQWAMALRAYKGVGVLAEHAIAEARPDGLFFDRIFFDSGNVDIVRETMIRMAALMTAKDAGAPPLIGSTTETNKAGVMIKCVADDFDDCKSGLLGGNTLAFVSSVNNVLHVCNRFFDKATKLKASDSKFPSSSKEAKDDKDFCNDNIGDLDDQYGSPTFMHELTHSGIFADKLKNSKHAVTGGTADWAYGITAKYLNLGFKNIFSLDKKISVENADSFSWFALAVTRAHLCDKKVIDKMERCVVQKRSAMGKRAGCKCGEESDVVLKMTKAEEKEDIFVCECKDKNKLFDVDGKCKDRKKKDPPSEEEKGTCPDGQILDPYYGDENKKAEKPRCIDDPERGCPAGKTRGMPDRKYNPNGERPDSPTGPCVDKPAEDRPRCEPGKYAQLKSDKSPASWNCSPDAETDKKSFEAERKKKKQEAQRTKADKENKEKKSRATWCLGTLTNYLPEIMGTFSYGALDIAGQELADSWPADVPWVAGGNWQQTVLIDSKKAKRTTSNRRQRSRIYRRRFGAALSRLFKVFKGTLSRGKDGKPVRPGSCVEKPEDQQVTKLRELRNDDRLKKCLKREKMEIKDKK